MRSLSGDTYFRQDDLLFLMYRWALDLFHCVDRKGCDFLVKFQSKTAEGRIDGLQVCEVHVSCTIGRWRGQPHRPP
ncbi:MAG: hypothetical protein JWQ49_5765, partial [Edaphobacter sp.]|nr:hypothetical protein [Edaphobacter sp.]